MKSDDKYSQPPRYDLYIVTENLGETEDSEVSEGGGHLGGHTNASYAASDTEERPSRVSTPGARTEERLRVEITNNNQDLEDGIVLNPVKVSNIKLALCLTQQPVDQFVFVSGQKTS